MLRAMLVRAATAAGLGVLGSLAPLMHAAAQDAAEDRATSFKAVTGAVKEDVPGGPLLLGAYAAILVVIIAYGIRLVRMQQRAQTDLARLERQITSHEQSAARK
jgi:hypothetical protein